MVSTLLSSLVVLAGHLSLSQADGGSPLFAGQGYIQVVNASEWSKVDLANRLGCMSETGAFTLDDCGVFTKAEDNPGLTSRLGNCSWRDDTQPANVDAIYGQRNYAWVCREGVDNWLYYTFSNTLVSVRKHLTSCMVSAWANSRAGCGHQISRHLPWQPGRLRGREGHSGGR